MELFSTTITDIGNKPTVPKTLYTEAESIEEAAAKFNRYLACQWVGYPWQEPEDFLAGVFDKIEDGTTVDIAGSGVSIKI